MKRSLLWSMLLVLFATLLPVAAVELGFRLTQSHEDDPAIVEPDSTLLYRLVPGRTKYFVHRASNGGGRIQVSINRDGYRGPPLNTVPGHLRVAVYGDSFIESEVSVDSQSFVRQLERNLAASLGRPVEAVNGGVVGYGLDQATLRFEREATTLRPDVVVIGVFADNDYGDLVRNRIYRLAPDGSVIRGHPVLSQEIQSYLNGWSHPTGWRRLAMVRWFVRRMEVRRGTERLVMGGAPASRFKPDTYVDVAAKLLREDFALATGPGADTVRNMLGDFYDADLATDPESPSAQYKRTLMNGVVADIRRVSDKVGIPVLLLVIPSPVDACSSYDIQVDSVRYPRYDRNRLSGLVVRAADSVGLRRLNLLEAFRAAGPCPLYFRSGDFHWNQAGQALAARVVADSLLHGFLRP